MKGRRTAFLSATVRSSSSLSWCFSLGAQPISSSRGAVRHQKRPSAWSAFSCRHCPRLRPLLLRLFRLRRRKKKWRRHRNRLRISPRKRTNLKQKRSRRRWAPASKAMGQACLASAAAVTAAASAVPDLAAAAANWESSPGRSRRRSWRHCAAIQSHEKGGTQISSSAHLAGHYRARHARQARCVDWRPNAR